jgi:hypothetical protein
MEGPKETVRFLFSKYRKDIRKYNSCTLCIYKVKKVYSVGLCMHPERLGEPSDIYLKKRGVDDFETPMWCPFLDSNNKRKVLFEKDINIKK